MKWISVILCFQIFVASLLPQMDFTEISKLPTLVKHYKIHQTEHNFKGSFLDFLSLHYGEKNNDNHDHKDLPFKSGNHSFDYNFNSVSFTLEPVDIVSINDIQIPTIYHSSFFSTYYNEILQPPKIG